MRHYLALAFAVSLTGCSIPPRTTVQITDKSGDPVGEFPIRFKLDEGMTHSSFLTPSSPSLKQIDSKTFEGKTDANGEIGISYSFDDRQPSDWSILLFKAKLVPTQIVEIIPLKNIPKGTAIKVGIPNP